MKFCTPSKKIFLCLYKLISIAKKSLYSISTLSVIYPLTNCCCRDGSSLPVCSTSSYTAQHFVHMCILLQHSGVIVPSQCYDVVVLWSPRRYRRSQSYEKNSQLEKWQSYDISSIVHISIVAGVFWRVSDLEPPLNQLWLAKHYNYV